MEKGTYILIHHDGNGLVLPQKMREQLLIGAEGRLIDIIESSKYSLQLEFFSHITRRPLTVILWGMEDRYGVATSARVEILVANDYGDASRYSQDKRPKKINEHHTVWE